MYISCTTTVSATYAHLNTCNTQTFKWIKMLGLRLKLIRVTITEKINGRLEYKMITLLFPATLQFLNLDMCMSCHPASQYSIYLHSYLSSSTTYPSELLQCQINSLCNRTNSLCYKVIINYI